MLQQPATTDQLAEFFARFQRLRETKPVLYDAASSSWHLFRYTEVLQVLKDTTRFASVETEAEAAPDATSVMALDPLQRQRVRTLLVQAPTPRSVNRLAPRIVERAQALLDRVRLKGEMDVIRDLAAPLSLSVLAELLGIPTAHWTTLHLWADALLAGLGKPCSEEPVSAHPQSPVTLAMHELSAYIDPLGVPEVMAGVRMLLEVGYGPATHLLGNTLLSVVAHPQVIEHLCQQPAPIYSTIEEVLRYLPPIWTELRTTTTEVTLGSQHLPAQARVCAWIVSANQDATQFLYPEQFDILRIPNRHLSLRYGIQAQLAGALARLVAATTIPLLLSQCADLKRVSGLPIEVVESPTIFGVKRLPITFVPRSSSA